jgi:hypothetical protein
LFLFPQEIKKYHYFLITLCVFSHLDESIYEPLRSSAAPECSSTLYWWDRLQLLMLLSLHCIQQRSQIVYPKPAAASAE